MLFRHFISLAAATVSATFRGIKRSAEELLEPKHPPLNLDHMCSDLLLRITEFIVPTQDVLAFLGVSKSLREVRKALRTLDLDLSAAE